MSVLQSLVGAARFPNVVWSFSRLGYERRARRFAQPSPAASAAGKRCVVTGPTAGIGRAMAQLLAEGGADLDLVCRDLSRGRDLARELSDAGAAGCRVHLADMTDRAAVARLAGSIPEGPIDAVVHNAGALFAERAETGDGLDQTFALHVVGPELLTRQLLPRLQQAKDGRVVLVSSGGMYAEALSVDKLARPPEPFDGLRAYAQAKRAQVELAQLWAQRAPGVRFFAMHPGWVDTEGLRASMPRFHRRLRRWLRSPIQGADCAVWLAVGGDVDLDSGAFVLDRAPAPRHMLPGTRASDSERQRLWERVDTECAAFAS